MKSISNFVKVALLFLILNFLNNSMASNSAKIDSFKQQLSLTKSSLIKIDLLDTLCWEMKRKNPDEAMAYAKQALDIIQESINKGKEDKNILKQKLAKTYNHIGLLYKNKGELDKALEYYNKSLKIREELNLKNEVAKSLYNIANIFVSKGNYLLALTYHNKALDIRKELNDKNDISASYMSIGLIYK